MPVMPRSQKSSGGQANATKIRARRRVADDDRDRGECAKAAASVLNRTAARSPIAGPTASGATDASGVWHAGAGMNATIDMVNNEPAGADDSGDIYEMQSEHGSRAKRGTMTLPRTGHAGRGWSRSQKAPAA